MGPGAGQPVFTFGLPWGGGIRRFVVPPAPLKPGHYSSCGGKVRNHQPVQHASDAMQPPAFVGLSRSDGSCDIHHFKVPSLILFQFVIRISSSYVNYRH